MSWCPCGACLATRSSSGFAVAPFFFFSFLFFSFFCSSSATTKRAKKKRNVQIQKKKRQKTLKSVLPFIVTIFFLYIVFRFLFRFRCVVSFRSFFLSFVSFFLFFFFSMEPTSVAAIHHDPGNVRRTPTALDCSFFFAFFFCFLNLFVFTLASF